MRELARIGEEWLIKRVADHEDEKKRIEETFRRVNEARLRFEVHSSQTLSQRLNLSLLKIADDY